MSRIMVVVEFEVKPQHRNQFIELIKGHAALARQGRLPAIRHAAAARGSESRVSCWGLARPGGARRALKGTDGGKDAGDLPTMAGQPSGNALYCRLSSLSRANRRGLTAGFRAHSRPRSRRLAGRRAPIPAVRGTRTECEVRPSDINQVSAGGGPRSKSSGPWHRSA
jgi:hypothetical protein